MHTYSQTFTKRRKRGIYYTPDALASQLARWAIRGRDARVMDPSFGGCAFLRASVDRLSQLRTPEPARQVYGADIDSKALTYLSSVLEKGARTNQFHIADFLSLRRSHFDVEFAAIVGNPPYVKHHALSQRLATSAQRALRVEKRQLSKKASYWAYFVLHSINFLGEGGRLAFILPGSLLHADYAHEVQKELCRSFAQVTALMLRERIFPDAQEETILLLADERVDGKGELRLGLASLDTLDLRPEVLESITRPGTVNAKSWMRALLDQDVVRVYSKLSAQSNKLGEKATVHIGTVTGANDYFILPPSVYRKKSLPKKSAIPILTRAAQLRGLVFKQKGFEKFARNDVSCFLLQPSKSGSLSLAFSRYLREGVREGIRDRYKCSNRHPWYHVPLEDPPDAFLSYMAGLTPRLVLNKSRVSCTNTIHSVKWKGLAAKEAKAIVLGFLSTLTQLSAELEGRSYGGGVLKLEPSEASIVVIPPLSASIVRSLFPSAHALCASGRHEDATRLVDSALLDAKFLNKSELRCLRRGIKWLRTRRLYGKLRSRPSDSS